MNTLLQHSKPFVGAIIVAFVLTKVAHIFLPDASIDMRDTSAPTFAYYNYNFLGSFGKLSHNSEQSFFSLEAQIALQAVYQIGKNGGFVTIFDHATSTSEILAKNESFNGYKLVRINKKDVVFSKDGQNITITLAEDETQKPTQREININPEALHVNFDGMIYTINKNYASAYVNNPDSFLANVQLQEKKSAGSTIGFELTYIKPNSLFSKIGFMVGDVIQSINNEELKNQNDALKLQKSLQNEKNINIKVLRNSNIMELNYEIK